MAETFRYNEKEDVYQGDGAVSTKTPEVPEPTEATGARPNLPVTHLRQVFSMTESDILNDRPFHGELYVETDTGRRHIQTVAPRADTRLSIICKQKRLWGKRLFVEVPGENGILTTLDFYAPDDPNPTPPPASDQAIPEKMLITQMRERQIREEAKAEISGLVESQKEHIKQQQATITTLQERLSKVDAQYSKQLLDLQKQHHDTLDAFRETFQQREQDLRDQLHEIKIELVEVQAGRSDPTERLYDMLENVANNLPNMIAGMQQMRAGQVQQQLPAHDQAALPGWTNDVPADGHPSGDGQATEHPPEPATGDVASMVQNVLQSLVNFAANAFQASDEAVPEIVNRAIGTYRSFTQAGGKLDMADWGSLVYSLAEYAVQQQVPDSRIHAVMLPLLKSFGNKAEMMRFIPATNAADMLFNAAGITDPGVARDVVIRVIDAAKKAKT